MNNKDREKSLVVLEMANNHMGDAVHGKRIIDAFAGVTAPYKDTLDFAIKYKLILRALIRLPFRSLEI